jgi:hypothetical protein
VLLIEVADTIFPRLGMPDWTVTFDLGQRTGLVERRSEPGPARPHRVV